MGLAAQTAGLHVQRKGLRPYHAGLGRHHTMEFCLPSSRSPMANVSDGMAVPIRSCILQPKRRHYMSSHAEVGSRGDIEFRGVQ